MSEKLDQLTQNKDVDTSQTTHISICSGYGGIDLGLRRVCPSLRTVAYAEIEAFAIECLLARMEGGQLDAAPIWSDLKSFPWAEFSGKVDILSGGYPCQPFSSAGLRKGTDDPRHLWPFIASGIRLLRPRICFFENVEGHISLGLREVIADLESLGYQTAWGIFSASECGAPHQRKRVFILANHSGERLQGDIARLLIQNGRKEPSGSTSGGCGSSGSGELANSNSAGGRQDWKSSQPRATGVEQSSGFERRCDAGEVREGQAWPSRPGEPQHAWEPPRVVANTESSVSRIKAEREWRESAGGGSKEVMGNPESGARLWRASGDEGHTAQSDQGMGNTTDKGQQKRGSGALGRSESKQEPQRPDCCNDNSKCEIEQPLGGDADGLASGLDYAKLCAACDNRTDELRLLGNGVVPATAALAFRTLLNDFAKGSA